MELLKKLLTFSLFVVSLIAVTYIILPKIDMKPLPDPLVEHDVPMPTMLHPVVNGYKNELVAKAEAKGIDIIITEGHRSAEKQNSLYEKGRSKEGSIVTNAKAGESYHNYGLAIDFALKDNHGQVSWDMNMDQNKNGESDWMEVVSIAKDMGFEWGGDWSNFKDYPHLQMNFGLSIRQLKYGQRPKMDAYADRSDE